jgi:DNA-binding protein HU-beta
MNKGELIAKMADDAEITRTQAASAFDSLLESITGTLKKGKKVTIVGFGTFLTSRRKARTGRNPQTGTALKIPAKRVARFTAGKQLKDSVNR